MERTIVVERPNEVPPEQQIEQYQRCIDADKRMLEHAWKSRETAIGNTILRLDAESKITFYERQIELYQNMIQEIKRNMKKADAIEFVQKLQHMTADQKQELEKRIKAL